MTKLARGAANERAAVRTGTGGTNAEELRTRQRLMMLLFISFPPSQGRLRQGRPPEVQSIQSQIGDNAEAALKRRVKMDPCVIHDGGSALLPGKLIKQELKRVPLF